MTLWYCSISSKDQSLGPGSGSAGRAFSGSGSLSGFFSTALMSPPALRPAPKERIAFGTAVRRHAALAPSFLNRSRNTG